MMMDLTHLMTNSTYMMDKTIPSTSAVHQSIPDSTTESPTTIQIDPMLQVHRPNELQPLDQNANRSESNTLDSLKTLNDSEVEAFTNLISDVSVTVEVDSTQPSQSLVDLPTYGLGGDNHNDLLTFQPLPMSQGDQQLPQTSLSQLIQSEFYKDEQKVQEHLIGPIDHRISRTLPDFSRYPPMCKCSFIDKLVAVEQIWLWKEQLYFLPQISILVIGNREYAGIFHDPNKGYIALGEIIERMMPGYQKDLLAFLERTENIDQCSLSPQETGYLEQRQCISSNTSSTYLSAVSLSMLRNMAQYIVMYEGHKPGFNNQIKEIANGNYYRKILQRHIRCGSCGGIILQSNEPEEYVKLSVQDSASKMDQSKCFSVGYILVAGTKYLAFKIDNRIYVSFKDLCQKKVMKLQVLQARLGALRQRPRLAPHVLNNYLNTPEYNVTNTMWIDIATLRCVCCMAKCSPGFNADAYGCFATVSFTEHFITNIYGKDDHQSDNAVYTMDPKTFEVIMKKTSMKSKSSSKPLKAEKPKQKSSLKSFELSSKENVGYDSPEKLNDSAFFFEKQEDCSWSKPKSSFREKPKSSKKENKSKKEPKPKTPEASDSTENKETYVFDDKESLFNFLKTSWNDGKGNAPVSQDSNSEKSKTKVENKYVPGKTPTFRVKPAQRPYSCKKSSKHGKEKEGLVNDSNHYQVSMENDKIILTVSKDHMQHKNDSIKTKENISQSVSTCKNGKKDETSSAVKNLVAQFDQEGVKEIDSKNCVSGIIESASITPRTETRILSNIDLDGSINHMFETPLHQKVVVEIMDPEQSQHFTDRTSPLSQLYQQYEQFENESSSKVIDTNQTPTKSDSTDIVPMVIEAELQVRNEQEMPIQAQSLLETRDCSKEDVTDQLSVDNKPNSSLISSGILKKKPIIKRKASFSERECPQIQRQQSLGRTQRAKTLSPPKNRLQLESPTFARLTRAASLNSPVFKESGEIDRSHAKVKRLSELEDRSQPLDLLASLAEVITDVSESQEDENQEGVKNEQKSSLENHKRMKEPGLKNGEESENRHNVSLNTCIEDSFISVRERGKSGPFITDNFPSKSTKSKKEKGLLCTFIADENSNIDKVPFSNTDQNFDTSELYCMKEIKTYLQDLVNRLIIEPCKDIISGLWKVKMQLTPGTHEMYPEMFGNGVDERKRNALLTMVAESFIPQSDDFTGHKSDFSSEFIMFIDKKDKDAGCKKEKYKVNQNMENKYILSPEKVISKGSSKCSAKSKTLKHSHRKTHGTEGTSSHKSYNHPGKHKSDLTVETIDSHTKKSKVCDKNSLAIKDRISEQLFSDQNSDDNIANDKQSKQQSRKRSRESLIDKVHKKKQKVY